MAVSNYWMSEMNFYISPDQLVSSRHDLSWEAPDQCMQQALSVSTSRSRCTGAVGR